MKTSCRDYSRYGVNTLGPLCLWQCLNCFSKNFQLVLDFFSILVLKFFSTFFIELSAGQLKMASKNYSQFLLPASNLYCMILTRHLKAMWYFIGKSMACLVTIRFISKTMFIRWCHDLLQQDFWHRLSRPVVGGTLWQLNCEYVNCQTEQSQLMCKCVKQICLSLSN